MVKQEGETVTGKVQADNQTLMRYEVFTVVRIQVEFFWVVTKHICFHF